MLAHLPPRRPGYSSDYQACIEVVAGMEDVMAKALRILNLVGLLSLLSVLGSRTPAWSQAAAGGAPASSASPAAAPTPVPPLTTPAGTRPLQFASPTPIDLTRPLGISQAPTPSSDLLKFDLKGAGSGVGIV